MANEQYIAILDRDKMINENRFRKSAREEGEEIDDVESLEEYVNFYLDAFIYNEDKVLVQIVPSADAKTFTIIYKDK